MRATWLPEVLRAAGQKVALADGWESRGRDLIAVDGVLCHHTAGPTTGNAPSLHVVRDGRPDLAGPLSQLVLGRDGTFYVVAAGRANHAGKGEYRGLTDGNGRLLGVEAENSGRDDDPWLQIQQDAYLAGVAAILRHVGRGAEWAPLHKEFAMPRGRKPDASFDGPAFRESLAAILAGQAPPPGRRTAAVESCPAPGQPVPRPTLRRGANGPLVAEVQRAAAVSPADGLFGPRTEAGVRAMQRARGLVPDGIVGPASWVAVDACAGGPPPPVPANGPLLRRGAGGDDVRRLQDRLRARGFDPGPTDGDFGAGTEVAVRRFQGAAGLAADGIVGRQSWAALG